jgi:hypothetical protein
VQEFSGKKHRSRFGWGMLSLKHIRYPLYFKTIEIPGEEIPFPFLPPGIIVVPDHGRMTRRFLFVTFLQVAGKSSSGRFIFFNRGILF